MADLTDFPLVSIIIVNYNGINFIDTCLTSVFAAEYPSFEVVFIDNASTDGSLKLAKEKFGALSGLKIIENKESLGPVKGRNIGMAGARGKYFVFLDNDTEVDKKWLNELVLVLEKDASIGAAQSKLLLSDRKTIDTCGHYLSICGFPYEIGVGEPDNGQYGDIKDIFGARSAAMFVRKEALEKSGYFDDDYFMHGEETDLSWRIWLSNYRIVYVPGSVVYHKRGGSLNERSRSIIFYEGPKNCTKTLIKNLGLRNLLVILPLHILGWFAVAVSLLLKKRFSDAKAVPRGLFWDLVNIRHVIKDRANVQSKRLVKDRQIMPVIMGDCGAVQLFKKGIAWICRT